jgi:hypothetical protein
MILIRIPYRRRQHPPTDPQNAREQLLRVSWHYDPFRRPTFSKIVRDVRLLRLKVRAGSPGVGLGSGSGFAVTGGNADLELDLDEDEMGSGSGSG